MKMRFIKLKKNEEKKKEKDIKQNFEFIKKAKIKQAQERFQIELDNLVQKEENNYNILNQRFKLIEQNSKNRKKINKDNISNNSSGAKKENNYSYFTEYSNYSQREKRTGSGAD